MKIRNTYFGIFSALVLFALLTAVKIYAKENTPAANSEQTITRQVKIEDFNKIEVSQGIHLVVIQRENPGVAKVKTTSKLDDMLLIETVNGCLKVFFDNGNVKLNVPKDATIVTVNTPTLKDIEVSSAANVVLSGQFSINGELEVEASSSGQLYAKNLSCTKLDIEASSASKVSIGDYLGNLDVDASSASTVEVNSIKGREIGVEASSASSVTIEKINCLKIKAEASGASKISLAGTCSQLKKDSSSGSRISHGKLVVRKN